MKKARVDSHGRAYAGSQLQIQILVNQRSDELFQRVVNAIPALAPLDSHLRWVSPLESENFAEYRDEAFLKALGLDRLTDELYRRS